MRTIWKFPLPGFNGYVMVPFGAEILTVQMQERVPCIWALVNPNAKKVPQEFRIFGTGHDVDVPRNWRYLGTVQNGGLVWHVFVNPITVLESGGAA